MSGIKFLIVSGKPLARLRADAFRDASRLIYLSPRLNGAMRLIVRKLGTAIGDAIESRLGLAVPVEESAPILTARCA